MRALPVSRRTGTGARTPIRGQQNEPEARGAIRNGVPVVPYRYQARRYSWAEANIRRAEAIYGTPEAEPDFEAG